MNKYPIYIVSKGRYESPLTANCFLQDQVPFKILVEPQEYEQYCKALGKENVLKLPFANLGQGSYPARNYAWEHAIKNGYDKHWCFDDNIPKFRRLHNGKRIPMNALKAIQILEDFTDRYLNIGITAFNYQKFVMNDTKKPFVVNVHAYSAMLIKNNVPFRWRMKYNEDVDLCLQFLHNKLCTVLFNAFMIQKISTVSKMKGGNQDELYKGNAYEKKVLKARSLEEIWPQYSETKIKFNRPHHHINWRKHFKHGLKRNPLFDWESLKKVNNYNMKLKQKEAIKSKGLKKWFKNQ
mgnify:CR=1 FL=1